MPGTDIVIEQNINVVISILALHMDKNYYEEPEKFNPDRFSDVNSPGKSPYLPFGDGPRNCIGMRLGKLQAKIALVFMLQKFKYDLMEDHLKAQEIKFDPRLFVLTPHGGLNLHIFKR